MSILSSRKSFTCELVLSELMITYCLIVTYVNILLVCLYICYYIFSAILNGKYDPHFPLQHQQKDLRLALQLGDKVEQPLYIAAAANEVSLC